MKYNTSALYRKQSKEIEVLLDDETSVTIRYTPAGIIQYGRLFQLFLSAFLPENLSENDIFNMTEDEKFKAATENLNSINTSVTEENSNEKNNELYSAIFLRRDNFQVVCDVIDQCFDLNANHLQDIVLMQLMNYLITELSNRLSSKT